jgi:hypothetical protein
MRDLTFWELTSPEALEHKWNEGLKRQEELWAKWPWLRPQTEEEKAAFEAKVKAADDAIYEKWKYR